MGAGSFNTIDNEKFVFNEPGVYTLLYIPKTLMNPEVRIQVRLERYPNRKIDFSKHYFFHIHSFSNSYFSFITF